MVSLNAIPHVRRVKLIAAVGHDARKRHRMLAFAGMGVMLLALGLVGGPALKRRRRLAGLYPDDALFAEPMTTESPGKWKLVFHIMGMCYTFLGLSTICDGYFTGALEHMVEKWKIKPDVAGATFMAAGGSAPELFTSLAGVFLVESSIGFGTIVGSAVFNVLFVIGLCAIAAHTDMVLTWFPLFRDCSYYICGLLVLAVFVKTGGIIEFWEACILFAMYLGYCTLMVFNPQLEEWADHHYQNLKKSGGKDAPEETKAAAIESLSRPSSPRLGGASVVPAPLGEVTQEALMALRPSSPRASQIRGKMKKGMMVALATTKRRENRMAALLGDQTDIEGGGMTEIVPAPAEEDKAAVSGEGDGEGDDEEFENIMEFPADTKGRIMWFICLPVHLPVYYTVPVPDEKRFLWTFGLSLVWIAVYAYFMVWWATTFGKIVGISDIIMGLTFLAAGTSIPDAISSVAVARIGEGDMAVSSSIGSNVFDILFGLPVPWMLKTGLVASINGTKEVILIESPFLVINVLLLLFMVIATVLAIHFNGWKLNPFIGYVMGCLYVVFVVVSVYLETERPAALMF